jgi:hypothetical protein
MVNPKITAAVSAALGLAALGMAHTASAQTAFTTCQSWETIAGTRFIYISGSSAAQSGFATGLAVDLFGGVNNVTTIKTAAQTNTNPVPNFNAYCGTTVATTNVPGIPGGSNLIIYYRGEGGSVTGLLPIVAQAHNTSCTGVANTNCGLVNQIQLNAIPAGTNVSCTTAAPLVCSIFEDDGTAPITPGLNGSVLAGPTDNFAGAVQKQYVDIGVTDVEPGQFAPGPGGVTKGTNYPVGGAGFYQQATYGSMTALQISQVTQKVAFQQTFGTFVNVNNAAISLGTTTVRNIYNGTYTDWSLVPQTTGAAASAAALPVVFINREVGSGSRASATAYWLGCGVPLPANGGGTPNGWSTGEVLALVAGHNGGITYASIDQKGKVAGATLVAMDGAGTPTNLLSATGGYAFVVESWLTNNPVAQALNGGTGQDGHGTAAALWTGISTHNELISIATAPHSVQVNAVPGAANAASAAVNPGSTVNGVTIFTGAFTKSGNTCGPLSPAT